MEQTPVGTRPDLVDDIGFKIDIDRPGNIFALASLGEESAESSIFRAGLALLVQVSIGLFSIER